MIYTHPRDGFLIQFKDSSELITFLRGLNPMLLRKFKKEYESKNQGYTIFGIGEDIRIVKNK